MIRVFEFRTTGSCIWISDYWIMYLNSGLRGHVFEFRTTGSCILIPDYRVMYLNYGLVGHVFEFRTSASCIWIPDYWVMYLNSGLLARSHYASRRSCDRPNWWVLSVCTLGPRANSEVVRKFHISLPLIDLPVQTSTACPSAALQKVLHSRSSVITQPSQYIVQNSAQLQQMCAAC